MYNTGVIPRAGTLARYAMLEGYQRLTLVYFAKAPAQGIGLQKLISSGS